MIFPKPAKKEFAYYLTALLNSRLLFFYLATYSPYVQAKYFTYKPQYLKVLPIVYNEENPLCNKIAELSKQLHQLYKKAPDVKAAEKEASEIMKQVDDLVFKLYGLTVEERKIIEEACL